MNGQEEQFQSVMDEIIEGSKEMMKIRELLQIKEKKTARKKSAKQKRKENPHMEMDSEQLAAVRTEVKYRLDSLREDIVYSNISFVVATASLVVSALSVVFDLIGRQMGRAEDVAQGALFILLFFTEIFILVYCMKMLDKNKDISRKRKILFCMLSVLEEEQKNS